MPLVARAQIPTPLGEMTALATARGLSALLFDGDKYHREDTSSVPEDPAHPCLLATADWLQAYWRGEPVRADGVPLDLHGSRNATRVSTSHVIGNTSASTGSATASHAANVTG